MIQLANNTYREIWLVDFEFGAPLGGNPQPICLVALELGSNHLIRLWEDELAHMTAPPYSTDADSLFVAYYSSAEWGCHLALGWPLPERVLDLYVEFRNLTNGLTLPCGKGLLGALTCFGLDAIEADEKTEMRDLALRGGPRTKEERSALLDYCESDVRSLARLLGPMERHIDLSRALIRGRYMAAAARIERCGVPIDTECLAALRGRWDGIQDALIRRIDVDYRVYDGRSFRQERWAQWLQDHGIPWPRLESGKLALDDDTFRDMARAYPVVAPIRELRQSLAEFHLNDLSVGDDGRNRCLLSAFSSRTGRNQPSNSRFIFGPAVWLRGLIRPEPGWGLAYIDWEQQEFGIAAALSGDEHMRAAYMSGDPYLAFAKQAGAVPEHGTKATHKAERDQFKACVLAVQYGMGDQSLAARIGQPLWRARELLELHKKTYPVYWRWSQSALDYAKIHCRLHTRFGWTAHVTADPRSSNPRSLQNFPMQANGAEMLRLACCLATEGGIRVCAPVHDAILIEAPTQDLESAVKATQAAMAEASRIVLEGFELRSEAKLIVYPERYMDERGQRMWDTVQELIHEVEDGLVEKIATAV